MLKEYKSMTQEEMYTLVHEIYIEGCMENAREKYPDNMPVSAARLSKINDFYYLEALETPPQYRKKGYASELLNEMITHLHQQGSVDIRDCVSKTNTASLATHKKCGFFIAEENGIYYPSNTVNNKTYGMRYFIR